MTGRFWRRWRRRKARSNRKSRLRRGVIWGIRVVLLIAIIDVAYLVHIWPDWTTYESGHIKTTAFIEDYKKRSEGDLSYPDLKWQQVKWIEIPKHIKQAVIVAEDSRFYQHEGFDIDAFKEAMAYNLEKKDFKYGASTISQQTVKNLFLSGSRNPLRKLNELILTLAMENALPKLRILEIYLNIAEFGEGIYGVASAAQYYYQIDISQISREQAAELAATLPSPRKHNPETRTKRFQRRVSKIQRFMTWVE